MRIRAALSREVGNHLSVEEVELDAIRSDEVRVKVAATGICHTDLSVMHGQFWPAIALPMVLGHEGAGVIEAIGDAVTDFAVGDHVVMSVNHCGGCVPCRLGTPGYCDDSLDRNFSRVRHDRSHTLHDAAGRPLGAQFFGQSSLATHAIARAQSVVRIPKDVPLELMGPMGCGLQTGAGAVFNVLAPRPGSSLVVTGAGTVGLAAVMAARIAGCFPIVAIDVRQERLDMALELGATHVIDARTGRLAEQVRAIVPAGIDAIVDTTAVPGVIEDGLETLRLAGSMVLLGSPPGTTKVSLPVNSLLVGRTVRGSIQGDAAPREFIPRLVELHRRGLFPFERFVRFYELDDIDAAIHDSSVSGAVVKAIVRMPR